MRPTVRPHVWALTAAGILVGNHQYATAVPVCATPGRYNIGASRKPRAPEGVVVYEGMSSIRVVMEFIHTIFMFGPFHSFLPNASIRTKQPF